MQKVHLFPLIIFALGFSGCQGPQGLVPMPFALGSTPNLPLRIFQAAPSSNLPLTPSFVKAYRATIQENEAITRQDPHGPAQQLIRLIDSAQQQLDGAFYDIGDDAVVQAFIRAHKRGVRVRLVTEAENIYQHLDCPVPNPPVKPEIQALQTSGIPLVLDNRSGLMHHKFLIQDGHTVWTGSTNLTQSSLYRHNNNALIITHPQLAKNFGVEFERMFVDKHFGPGRPVPFPEIQLGGMKVRTFFSPKGGGNQAVVNSLQQAQKRISFMTFSLTDKTMGGVMIQKKQAGLQIQGLFDQCLKRSKYSLFYPLRQANIYVREDGNEALLHHKSIIVDRSTVINGSYNFSNNAENSNNESLLIFENAPELAETFEAEFQRVDQAANQNKPPPNKCPGVPDPDAPPCP